ncbi:MAG: transferrin-binding protein-like solute binding protein [Pseudomonadota bacterium]
MRASQLCLVVLMGFSAIACSTGSSGTGTAPTTPPAPTNNTSLSNLTVSETFYAANATITGDVGILSTISNATVTTRGFETTDASTRISYDAAADSFRIEASGGPTAISQVFRPQDIDATESDADFTIYETGDSILVLLNANAPVLDLSYVTLATWADADAGGGASLLGYSVFGVETPFADTPASGSASYSGEVVGGMVESGRLYNFAGTASVDADFSAASVDTTLVILRALLESSAYAPWNVIESTASITSITNGVSGRATASFVGPATALSSPSATGELSGRFFGPNAEEVGGEFSLSEPGVFDAGGVFVARQP